MTQEEIIRTMIGYLDAHLRGVRGALSQDPYKKDFFRLFAEACEGGYFETSSRPRLTGDALRDILYERWVSVEGEEEKPRFELMDRLMTWWDEWRYAWENRHLLPERDERE